MALARGGLRVDRSFAFGLPALVPLAAVFYALALFGRRPAGPLNAAG